MRFKILGERRAAKTIAVGSGIREVARLRKLYGRGRWRERTGIAEVRLRNGQAPRFTGMKQVTLGRRNSRSSASCRETAMAKATKRLVICLNNDGYEASLERRKIYVALPDPRA